MGVKKCLDTYALVEIKLGNSKFSGYLNKPFIILDLILAEFYAVILREEGKDEADFWFKKLERYSVSVSKHTLVEAIRFRQKYLKRKISFFDAVGCVFSLKNNCAFVTGDKEFENFKGVEFRKK